MTDIHETRIRRCCEPYQRESGQCLFRAVIVFLVVGLLFGAIGGFRIWRGFIWVMIAYLLAELLTNGYLGIASMLEMRCKAFAREPVFLERVEIASA